MHTLGLHFDKMLDDIQPPSDRLEKAKTLPGEVRQYLADHEDFETKSPHSRLVGSYRQHLTVGDVKDVDFLVRVDGDPEANDPKARAVLRDLKDALDGLPEYLETEGTTSIDRNRRSVHVGFDDEDFHLDVVPCIAPDDFDEPIFVPDWGFETWIKSHPLGVVELVKDLEAEHSGKFRNTTKLLKYFRNVQMTYKKPKSYWLVAMAIEAFRGGHVDSSQPLAVVFDELLNHLHSRFLSTYNLGGSATPNIADPMLGHNVSWNWERGHFETFMHRLDDGKRWSGKALVQDDKQEAIKYWRKVFGDAFPEDVTDYARMQATMARPGAAHVAPAGLILPKPSSDTRSTPIPPTRYYGDEEE